MEGASFLKPLKNREGGFKILMAGVGGGGIPSHILECVGAPTRERERNQRRKGIQRKKEREVAEMIVTY